MNDQRPEPEFINVDSREPGQIITGRKLGWGLAAATLIAASAMPQVREPVLNLGRSGMDTVVDLGKSVRYGATSVVKYNGIPRTFDYDTTPRRIAGEITVSPSGSDPVTEHLITRYIAAQNGLADGDSDIGKGQTVTVPKIASPDSEGTRLIDLVHAAEGR
ncbi:hypothetical protein CMO83_01635 [Candidatus Woesearchaeota archaeon]|jgi:hypothetical protein|nr:hypothetical protein [Candidatus Woesearchaeota archaeon]MDP6648012.1 hypothetical protein [Candidatus Woesearchaeota archaeon]|tara:strand:- start:50203 stop:50685 length:483 start_codon:yes stop_codon:yes gene_type:complete